MGLYPPSESLDNAIRTFNLSFKVIVLPMSSMSLHRPEALIYPLVASEHLLAGGHVGHPSAPSAATMSEAPP